jgi:hypothetical protein
MINNLVIIAALLFFVIPGETLSQDAPRIEFNKLFNKLEDYDDSEYKLLITDLVKFLDKYPKYTQARAYLFQVLGTYKDKIRFDDEIITLTIRHFDTKSPLALELYLAYYYRIGDKEKVDEVIGKIRSVPVPPKFGYKFILEFDANINMELFNHILLNLYPFITFDTEWDKYLYYYMSGQVLILDEILNNQPVILPYYILGKIDPDLHPDIYLKYFSQSLPSDPKLIIDSVINTPMYLNICKQYLTAGNTDAYNLIKNKELDRYDKIDDIYRKCKLLYRYKEYDQYGYLIKKLYNSITPSDTALSSRFFWGISCLELKQIYKAEQFLSYVFLYGKDSETPYYKTELEWWAANGLQPEVIRRLLLNVFGQYSPADTSSITAVKKEEDNIAPARTTVTDSSYGTYHALLIAVQDYQDSLIQDLQNPITDARKFKDILAKNYNFNHENITLLENPGRQDIFNSLSNYSNTLSEKDNLLIFYAGHGHWNEEIRQGYWIPADANRRNQSRWITNTSLCDMLAMIRTKHTLLITDACFSGAIFKQRDVKEVNMDRIIGEIYKHPSRKAITSGTLKEVPDQSIFIEKLLRMLEENEDKYLLAENLYYGIRRAVINQSNQIPLYGALLSAGDEEKGDFIFVKK